MPLCGWALSHCTWAHLPYPFICWCLVLSAAVLSHALKLPFIYWRTDPLDLHVHINNLTALRLPASWTWGVTWRVSETTRREKGSSSPSFPPAVVPAAGWLTPWDTLGQNYTFKFFPSSWSTNTVRHDEASMIVGHLLLGRKAMVNLDSILKSRDITLPTKFYLVKAMVFSSSHVWIWELDCEKSWAPKNWRFGTVVLEKTRESPLDCKEIEPIHPKGNQSWIFIARTDAETEAPIF